jgi:hypothetical protein
MASIKEIIAEQDPDGNVEAQHDVIYAGPDPDKYTPEVIGKLKELGWLIDSENGTGFRKWT